VPIYTYSYREAVIDGYLVDHEPPIQINTELSDQRHRLARRRRGPVYDARRNQIDLFTTPDEIKLEVEDFNRKVITESFNRVVCEYLAGKSSTRHHAQKT
jgi:type I restriction enzyme R subunit